MGRFRSGQIILAHLSDSHHGGKLRPALIISKDQDNHEGLPLLVIAITSRIEDPCPSYHVRMPYGRPGPDNPTGLTIPCVAKCNWAREIDQDRVRRSLGYVPVSIFEEVITAFDRVVDDPGFTDWV